MQFITQQQIDFWNSPEFIFEEFYTVHPVTGIKCVWPSRTNFNYIQYLKVLIELERRKIIASSAQGVLRDESQSD